MRRVVVEERFREAAHKRRQTGIMLLAAAGLLMAYAAWQLFTPYTTEGGTDCHPPVMGLGRDTGTDDVPPARDADRADPCVTDGREWPAPVTALLLALPLTAVGTAKCTSGSLALRLRDHEDDVRRSEP